MNSNERTPSMNLQHKQRPNSSVLSPVEIVQAHQESACWHYLGTVDPKSWATVELADRFMRAH
jgi:hypothetical protein